MSRAASGGLRRKTLDSRVRPPDPELLQLEAAAFASFGNLLGPDVSQLASPTRDLLGETLRELGADSAVHALERTDDTAVSDTEQLKYIWTTLFVRCTIPPYETSYMSPSLVGHVGELADIAGFYRAYGFEVHNERSDHLLPELEFASIAALMQARAIIENDQEAVETTQHAREAFLQQHIGCWVDDFAARLGREDPGNPYLPVVESAAALISHICESYGIEPQKPVPTTLPSLGDVVVDSDDAPVACYGDPVPLDELELPPDNLDKLDVRAARRDR